jgi:hypothetical protein
MIRVLEETFLASFGGILFDFVEEIELLGQPDKVNFHKKFAEKVEFSSDFIGKKRVEVRSKMPVTPES